MKKMKAKEMKAKEMKAKGQVSVEFFILFVVLITIFILFIGLTNQFGFITKQIIAKEKSNYIALNIARIVNAVFISGNGTSAVLSIPQNYTINYQARSIIVEDNIGNIKSAPVLINNINLSISSGAQELTIQNINGKVFIGG